MHIKSAALMWRSIAIRISTIFAFALACGAPMSPLPSSSLRFAPPAIYQTWWSDVEACSGKTGDFSAVSWYRVSADSFVVAGEPVDGYWYGDGNRIVILSKDTFSARLVHHESLHAILKSGAHDSIPWFTTCHDLVY